MEEEFLSSEQLISDLLLWFWTANSANVPYGFTKQTFQLCCHSGSQKKNRMQEKFNIHSLQKN